MGTRLDLPPPSITVEADDGGGAGWVRLLDAQNDIDAHLLVGRLDEAGIEVRSIKDRSGPAWMHGGSDPWAPVALWVKRYQHEDARIVLAELSFHAPPAVRVASAPGPSRRHALVWWLAALALGSMFTLVSLARSADHFERCGLAPRCPTGARP